MRTRPVFPGPLPTHQLRAISTNQPTAVQVQFAVFFVLFVRLLTYHVRLMLTRNAGVSITYGNRWPRRYLFTVRKEPVVSFSHFKAHTFTGDEVRSGNPSQTAPAFAAP